MHPFTRTLRPDFLPRSSGILLHMTSLPGPHGCGDLGAEAHRFLEFLAASGQRGWQMLPIGPPGRAPGWSPYDSASAFAGSPWLVSLTALAHEGLLSSQDLKPARGLSARRVNFPAARRYREERLRQAFASFRRRRGERHRSVARSPAGSRAHLPGGSPFGRGPLRPHPPQGKPALMIAKTPATVNITQRSTFL